MHTDDFIAQHCDDLVAMAQQLCRIPSVKGSPEAGAPFGREVKAALDCALSLSSEKGLSTTNVDGYCGFAEYGEGEEVLAIVTHLDVVPAGDNWSSPPFSADVRDGHIYARGIVDDKGPAAAAIMALWAVRACGIPLSRRVRLLFGCDEESGMADIPEYINQHGMPHMAFTPDAAYPVINCEKHIMHARMEKALPENTGQVSAIEAGLRYNVVPDKAAASLRSPLSAAQKSLVEAYALENSLPIEVTDTRLVVRGATAHASRPEAGINAAGHLLLLLASLGVFSGEAGAAIAYLAQHLGVETDGASLGMALQDDASGPLTANLGLLTLKDGCLSASIDIRCPVSVPLDSLKQHFSIAAQNGGFTPLFDYVVPGIFVEEKSELVQALLSVYEGVTGLPGTVQSTGGGTYARKFPGRAVAFGPVFPNEEDQAHNPNETMSIKSLVKNATIFARAITALAAKK